MKAHRRFPAASRSFWLARYVICLASVLLFACDDDEAKTQASHSAGSDQTEGGRATLQQSQSGGETADGMGGGQNPVGGDQDLVGGIKGPTAGIPSEHGGEVGGRKTPTPGGQGMSIAGRPSVGGQKMPQAGSSAPRGGDDLEQGGDAMLNGGQAAPVAGDPSLEGGQASPVAGGPSLEGGQVVPADGGNAFMGGQIAGPEAGQPVPVGGMAVVAPQGGEPNEACLTPSDYLRDKAWPELFGTRCVGCHQQGGPAQNTRLVLSREGEPDWLANNLASIQRVVEAEIDGVPLLLLKPRGQPTIDHGGGRILSPGTPGFELLEGLVYRMTGDLDACGQPVGDGPIIGPEPGEGECGELTPGRRMLRRLSHREYQNTVRDLLGLEIDAAGAFVADTVVDGFANNPDALFVGGLLAEQYRQMAEALGKEVDVSRLLPCELAEADMNCGHRFIAEFGLKAFRRPLTEAEIAGYRSLLRAVVAEECFEEGVRWVVAAMLQSPFFLYRSELGRRVGDEFVLTPYELATQLSYLFWQTMPDETLFAQARSGEILNPAALRLQVQRLLEDPRSIDMANDFVARWLHIDQLMVVIRDAEIYAALYFELRESMLKETEFLVGEIWRDGRSFVELFTTESSWLDDKLAAYYGIERNLANGQVNDAGFAKTQVEASRPGGILTHGSFLTTHASATTSSPINRGVIVQERLLCEHLDPPPIGLVVEPPLFDPNASTREKFAEHSAQDACRECHRLIDPIGFGFEGFDGIGRAREMDGNQPVDVSGELTRRDADGTPFNGVGELSDLLSADDAVHRCYVRQWVRFGFGEAGGLDGRCYVEHLSAQFNQANRGISSVLAALPETVHFWRRTGEPDEGDVPGADLVVSAEGELIEANPAIPPADLAMEACGNPPAPPGAGNLDDERIELVVLNDNRWGTGYCQDYSVQNTSDEDVVDWAVRILVPGPITSGYTAERDADIGWVVFRPGAEWARTIRPGQQVTFGFCGTL